MDGDLELAGEPQALAEVILVLVGEHHRVGRPARAGLAEPLDERPRADPRVDQHARASRLEERGVAAAPAGEDGDHHTGCPAAGRSPRLRPPWRRAPRPRGEGVEHPHQIRQEQVDDLEIDRRLEREVDHPEHELGDHEPRQEPREARRVGAASLGDGAPRVEHEDRGERRHDGVHHPELLEEVRGGVRSRRRCRGPAWGP